MQMFETRDDVEEWLAPMNYEQFWLEIKPWCLVLPYTRAQCDADIAAGEDRAEIMDFLKGLAEYALARRHNLKRRPVTVRPVLRVVSTRE